MSLFEGIFSDARWPWEKKKNGIPFWMVDRKKGNPSLKEVEKGHRWATWSLLLGSKGNQQQTNILVCPLMQETPNAGTPGIVGSAVKF